MPFDATSTDTDWNRDQIDLRCDGFEVAWLNGQRPSIRDFIADCDQSRQADLFYELLLVDIEFRCKAGEAPSADDYFNAFPQYRDRIETAQFRRNASSGTVVNDVDDTISSGSRQVGSQIKHFELIERLGAGAMGEVWRARDTRLRRTVAIKLVHTGSLSERDLQRIIRESQSAAQLNHPLVASVFEAGRVNETAYIVTDFVEGQSLREILDRKRFSHLDAARLCAEVAGTLQYAHSQEVVHRDVKPANIVIDRAGKPHIIDFGLAKWSPDDKDLTQHGDLLGTPAYMSPEQASGHGVDAGPGSDVYSLGVVLYEMLSGRCPFRGNRAELLNRIGSPYIPAPRLGSNIPRDLETICLKALQKDVSRRYQSAGDMAQDLRRFVRGEPILARRTSHFEKTWLWMRRRPAAVAALLMAVVALTASVTATTFVEKNRALTGIRIVSFTTEPPGAKVAFARLNDLGELASDEPTRPRGITPLEVDLEPGDHFVEVVWPDGRFHQVLRHVPHAKDRSLSVTERHHRWKIDDEGSIVLPPVRVPMESAGDGMKMVPFATRYDGRRLPQRDMSFLVDGHDFTVSLVRNFREQAWRVSGRPGAEIATLSFEDAADVAESAGKRLPTSLEYQQLLRKNQFIDDPPDPASKEAIRYDSILPGRGFRCVRSLQPWFIESGIGFHSKPTQP